jgi:hypothetical protein
MGWAQLPTRARASTNGMNWLLVNMRCSWSSICGDQPAKWSPTTAARLRSDAAMSTPPQRVGRAIQLGRLPPRDPPGPGVAATVEWVAAAQRREPSGTLSLRTTAQGRGGRFCAAYLFEWPLGPGRRSRPSCAMRNKFGVWLPSSKRVRHRSDSDRGAKLRTRMFSTVR